MSIAPRPQLLTYPDSLGGDLATLGALLAGPLSGLFHGVHILPPFPSSADRGFAPLTYREIDPRFGTWDDIERIAETHDVLLDVMINHISRQSAEFQDFQRRGRHSPHADLFITLDKVWPDGDPPAADVARIFLRKPDSPFSTVTIGDTGATERVWTSFGTADWSEQIDLDVTAPATRALITDWLRVLASHGVRIVRLDAVGYVVKKAGTSCFMVEPEIYEFLDWITGVADTFELILLPEVHDRYSTHRRLSAHGYWTYDFVLPGLVLHAFHTGKADGSPRTSRAPAKQFTTLDCHDGIPVRPDLDGLLEPAAMRDLAERTVARGGNVNQHPLGRRPDRTRRPPAQLHVLLGARRRRRPLPRRPRDPAVRPRRPADLLRRPARRRERPRRGRRDRRRPGHQPPRLHNGGTAPRPRPSRRQAADRTDPAPQHPPRFRRQLARRERERQHPSDALAPHRHIVHAPSRPTHRPVQHR